MNTEICFVSPKMNQYVYTNPESAGGAERQQYLLSREFENLGFELSYITAPPNSPAEPIRNDLEIRPVCPDHFNTPYDYFSKTMDFIKAVRTSSADYYYVRGLPRLAVLTSLVTSYEGRDVLYCIAADSNVDKDRLKAEYSRATRVLYRRMLRTATVVSQTKSQARTLSDGFGVDSTVIPNGCVITPESRLPTTANGPDVLWVGRIQHQQKRPDRVLDLAEKTNGIQYEIVGPLEGSNDYCDRFLQRIETLDNVQYSGFVNPEEMVEKYASADILLNTSDYEGFPNTFLEAWQCKVPVVSQYYSFDNRLQDLDFGFRTGGLTPTANTLRNLLDDQERLKTIGQRARQFVIDNYSIQNVATDYETLLS